MSTAGDIEEPRPAGSARDSSPALREDALGRDLGLDICGRPALTPMATGHEAAWRGALDLPRRRAQRYRRTGRRRRSHGRFSTFSLHSGRGLGVRLVGCSSSSEAFCAFTKNTLLGRRAAVQIWPEVIGRAGRRAGSKMLLLDEFREGDSRSATPWSAGREKVLLAEPPPLVMKRELVLHAGLAAVDVDLRREGSCPKFFSSVIVKGTTCE